MNNTETSSATILIVCLALVISTGIGTAISIMVVERAAFPSASAAAAKSFALLISALPAVLTITLIIVATALLTAYRYLESSGCIAIFSIVASFVPGGETQRRKSEPRASESDTPSKTVQISG
jgi:hypothetical protein